MYIPRVRQNNIMGMSLNPKPQRMMTDITTTQLPMQNRNILDAGCGTGEWLSYVRTSLLGCHALTYLVGLDLDQEALKEAKTQVPRDKVDFVRGTIHNLPFKDNAFSIIISNVTMPYVDQKRSVTQMSRVLNSEGLLFISHHGFSWYIRNTLSGKISQCFCFPIAFGIFLFGSRFRKYVAKLASTLRFRMSYTTLGSMQTISRFHKALRKFNLIPQTIRMTKMFGLACTFYMIAKKEA